MKKFLKTLLIFGLLFFVLEKAFYGFLLVAPTVEVDKRLEVVLNGELNKDLVVFGSSRGARNIIASQIEDSLNLTAYNLSYPGSDIEFHEFLLKSLLKFNYHPKDVILVVDDPKELLFSEQIKFRLDRLYPLSKYRHINDELIKRGEKSILSKIFILSRINRKNFDLSERTFREIDTIFDDGSMPIASQKPGVDFSFINDVPKYEIADELDNKRDAFIRFQNLCVDNNINLHIVFPPNFYKHNNLLEKRFKEISNTKVSFYVYDTLNPIYKNENYFYDLGHLKKNGAVVFTDEIINYLKTDM